LRTAGGVAETGPERRRRPDAAWHRRVGLRCALADAKPSDGKYHGCRVERLHLHGRFAGEVWAGGRGSPRPARPSMPVPAQHEAAGWHRQSRFITPPNRPITPQNMRIVSAIAKYRPRTCRRDGGLAQLRHSVWSRLIEDRRWQRGDVIQPGAADSTAHVAASRSASPSAATSGGQRVRCRCCREHDGGEDNHRIA
jgi:hypothetical protein